jgi:hypothetical protein
MGFFILLILLYGQFLTVRCQNCQAVGKAQHQKIPEFAKNDLWIVLQNFVFLSFWPVTKMEDA